MSAIVDIRAPAEQTEGTRSQVLRWLKQVGERVTQNEPLIELETDKVTVEVASPAAGVLREILKQEADEIAPGELLGRLETAAASATVATPGIAAAAEAIGAGAQPAAAARRAASAPVTGGARAAAARATPLSPAVRRLLAEHQLEADAVSGSGDSTVRARVFVGLVIWEGFSGFFFELGHVWLARRPEFHRSC